MTQGETLDACIGDCFSVGDTVDMNDAIAAYIVLSRVRRADDLLITRPFPPTLLRQGNASGPMLLMRFLQGGMEAASAGIEWARLEAQRKAKKEKPELLTCGTCPPEQQQHSANDFDRGENENWKVILEAGHWRRCKACQDGLRYHCNGPNCGMLPRHHFGGRD